MFFYLLIYLFFFGFYFILFYFNNWLTKIGARGTSALWQACAHSGRKSSIYSESVNYLSVIDQLLSAGAEPNILCRGYTPLRMACRQGSSLALISRLIDAGADVNDIDDEGRTLLWLDPHVLGIDVVAKLVGSG